MIDVESEVFTKVAGTLRETFPGVSLTGEYVRKPPSFPHVSIEVQDSSVETAYQTSADAECYSAVLVEVNVYSNKTSGKKMECKAILKLVDDLMFRLNFTRISCSPVPNMEDASIYRMTARYRAVTDGKTMYRR